jgi:hypothetical protein
MAGHVGLELRNVDTNYRFERSHRFAGIQPNSGFGDYSRLSCGVGQMQLGSSGRISDKQTLIDEIAAWKHDRNAHHTKADWQFTTKNARIKLKHLYPSI